ncbi:MAG: hypothetical protein A2W99_08235 [Bacteroidetes bacterium GWF2_33_16]|nr:MAG: hypothetical protein A2X00_11315 [Bacteroidetes bacterium GWE2_32_14]OFY03832.1 MAG: hypothetical protein A2W99_08235 [Bacteroidetes bacterium GWF2_33_16]
MNKGRFKDLIEKYEQGESTLQEEQIIVDNTESFPNEYHAWFKFIQINKEKAPKGLQDSVWESIHKKKILNLQLKVGMLSAAASILVLLSIAIYKPFGNMQSYNKKEALLKEALEMFENKNTKSALKPIYEDDIIIIYASAE